MRTAALLLAAAVITGCTSEPSARAATSPAGAPSDDRIAALASSIGPATVGIAIKPIGEDSLTGINLDKPMPMQSVFKAALGAAVLARVDAGELDLSRQITISETDLAPPFSPIADGWPQRSSYSVAELIEAAAGHSDNTAADVLAGLIGGPAAVTAFLRDNGIDEMRVDRTERQLQTEATGVPAFRPDMRGETAWSAVMANVPESQRRAALDKYLADPRDTSTPRAAIEFLDKLATGKLLSSTSTALLIKVMTESPTGRMRLRAGLPEGASVAHKTGTGRRILGVASAMNDIGIATLPNGRRIAVAVFVNGTRASDAEIDALHAQAAAIATGGPRTTAAKAE